MNAKKAYTYRVNAEYIDFRKKVSLVSLSNFILSTAGKNADENGFGLLELQSRNYTWVLSRFVIDMCRFPVENETIIVETWIQDVGVAFTTRNFRIATDAGEVLGYASSSWAVIDMETRRSISLTTLPGLQRFIVAETTPIGVPQRIANIKGTTQNKFNVQYSDIDVNGHANSLHYIQWISDCFSLDFYRSHVIKRFEINFLKELIFGDEGSVFHEEKQSNNHSFQIVSRDIGIACRARIIFEENKEMWQ